MNLHRRRDYYQKNFVNPFFKKSKSGFHYYSKGKSLRRKIVLFLLMFALIGWIWFLFYSSYFQIEKIEVSGTEKISPEEIKLIIDDQIKNSRFLIFKQNNIFLFNKMKAYQKINSQYALEHIEIRKKMPNTILVGIKEKTAALILGSNDRFYEIDVNGAAIREIFNEEKEKIKNDKQLLIVYDESNQEVNIKEKIFEPNTIQFIIALKNNLSEKTNIKIATLKIPNRESNEIKVLTEKGYYIYFRSDKDVLPQIEKLNLTLNKIEEQKNLEYIDLRFEDRVYYK
jgi:cell division protein FtsQ